MNVVYNRDCMEAMREMPDKCFDLAIVDPPYGIGDTWSKSRKDRFFQKGKMHGYQNTDIPVTQYFKELFRVSKNQIIWGGNYFTEFLPATNAWIVWDKGRNADITFMSEGELAWTSFSKVLRICDFLWDGARKCEVVDKIHPHQKPVKLYRWLLQNYAGAGSKILDTHVGSGSIRIACDELSFPFEGFEIDADYYQAQELRYQRHKSQLALF